MSRVYTCSPLLDVNPSFKNVEKFRARDYIAQKLTYLRFWDSGNLIITFRDSQNIHYSMQRFTFSFVSLNFTTFLLWMRDFSNVETTILQSTPATAVLSKS